MNILYCGDKNIECGVLYSVLSLLKNTKGPLHIYILTAGLDAGDVRLEAMPPEVAEGFDWLVKSVSEAHFVKLLDATKFFQAEVPSANLGTRFTPGCMLRLYADCFPELPDKVLYLDYDVVCRRDCQELFDQDISDCEFAGVLDHYGRWFFRKRLFRADYVNSGVLLMNLAKMRQTGRGEEIAAPAIQRPATAPRGYHPPTFYDHVSVFSLAKKGIGKALADRKHASGPSDP